MDKSTTLDTFSRSRYSETGNFVNTPYELNEIEKNSSPANISFTLRRDGFILQDDQQMPVSIEKSFLVDDAAMKISSSYSVTNKSKRFVDMWFGIEFNFTLLAGSDPLRYYSFPVDKKEKIFMNSEEAFQNISGFEIRNEWDGFALKFAISPEAGVWTFPLETVSQSEDGLERTYQGSSMLIHWKAPLAPGKEHKRSIALTLYKIT
jgi:4-alpha-glucanotransferase